MAFGFLVEGGIAEEMGRLARRIEGYSITFGIILVLHSPTIGQRLFGHAPGEIVVVGYRPAEQIGHRLQIALGGTARIVAEGLTTLFGPGAGGDTDQTPSLVVGGVDGLEPRGSARHRPVVGIDHKGRGTARGCGTGVMLRHWVEDASIAVAVDRRGLGQHREAQRIPRARQAHRARGGRRAGQPARGLDHDRGRHRREHPRRGDPGLRGSS